VKAGGTTRTVAPPRRSKNLSGKKKLGRGLTRVQLAEALNLGLTTIDKLIAHGLRPVGARGRAPVYQLGDARRLRRQLTGRDQVDSVLLSDYLAHSEDFRDRTEQLRREWVADNVWTLAWRRVVVRVDRLTRRWPAQLADRLGSLHRDQQDLVAWCDGPRVLPPQPAACLGPEAFAAWQARCAELSALPGLMRPLLADAAAALRAAGSLVTLSRALVAPPPARAPRRPRTVDAARDAWRQARADFRRARVVIRRGHRRRADVIQAINLAIVTWRNSWWAARGVLASLAADRAGAFAFAQQLRIQTSAQFAMLGGLLPAGSVRSPRRKAAER